MDRERKLAKSQIGALYHRLKGVPLERCFYCGAPRQSLDHCPPLSVAYKMSPAELRKRDVALYLVPSCMDCNSLLGARKWGTPWERLNGIYHILQAKIDKEYHGWTKDDLEELGPGLREYIQNRAYHVNFLIEKLRGVEDNMLRYDPDRDVSEA